MEQRFIRATELFADLLSHCTETGIFLVVDHTGGLRLYDADSVFNLAEQEFDAYDDPILALTNTLNGVETLENNLGFLEAGYVDMVF